MSQPMPWIIRDVLWERKQPCQKREIGKDAKMSIKWNSQKWHYHWFQQNISRSLIFLELYFLKNKLQTCTTAQQITLIGSFWSYSLQKRIHYTSEYLTHFSKIWQNWNIISEISLCLLQFRLNLFNIFIE